MDSAAFKVIYQHYADKLYYVCLRYLKNRPDACDALQEGFIQAYKKISSFSGKGSFEGWLKRIIVNKCLEFLRKRKVYEELDNSSIVENYYEEPFELEYYKEDENLKKVLLNAVNQLSDGYRTIVNLVIIEGYSHKEVSEFVGISVSTSRSQLVRARAQLKKYLTADQPVQIIKDYYDRI
ncbi:MAG: RNA polymerase sigma factor [Aureispira sp.]|nr:RNA polymerase sigma factor [Aureispira sp.]